MSERQKNLLEERAKLLNGDAARIAKQHDAGKRTARERIAALLDAGSLVELNALRPDSNVVAGSGTVNGLAVYCFAQDFASCSGAMTAAQTAKILKTLDMAQKTGAPVIALLDSAGVKLADGAAVLPGYAEILARFARLSGVCPLISCVVGPCNGMAALLTAMCDVNIQVEKIGQIALHSALVMNSEKGKEKSAEELYGAETMAKQGIASLVAKNEDEAFQMIAALVDYLPSCNMEDAVIVEQDDLNRQLVYESNEDVRMLMRDLADCNRTLELFEKMGQTAVTAFARLGGHSVGLVGQNGGRLCACDCKKIARFVRLCDCYSLPVITLVNNEGLKVPPVEKQGMMIKAAADLCCAYAEATTAKIAVIVGDAVGAGYVAMGGKAVADAAYAWPNAMVAPLTKETAVQTLELEKLHEGADRAKLEEEYAEKCGAMKIAQIGLVDDVIQPKETRKYVLAAMEMMANKHVSVLPKKHGNMPL